MRTWLIQNELATAEELESIETNSKKEVLEGKKDAWAAYVSPMKEEQQELVSLLNTIANSSTNKVFIEIQFADLASIKEPIRKEILMVARKVLRMIVNESSRQELANWITNYTNKIQPKFSSHLCWYS